MSFIQLNTLSVLKDGFSSFQVKTILRCSHVHLKSYWMLSSFLLSIQATKRSLPNEIVMKVMGDKIHCVNMQASVVGVALLWIPLFFLK